MLDNTSTYRVSDTIADVGQLSVSCKGDEIMFRVSDPWRTLAELRATPDELARLLVEGRMPHAVDA